MDVQFDAEPIDRQPADLPLARARPAALVAIVAAAAFVGVLALAAVVHSRRPAAPPSTTSTAHLSLSPVSDYVVSGAETAADREILSIDYVPTPGLRYSGGTVTLYAPGAFDATSLVATAQRLAVGRHIAYFGRYQHEYSLAWPISAGRWVCLSEFLDAGNGTDPAVSRAAELSVAAAVVTR